MNLIASLAKEKPVIFAFHGYEGLIKDLFFEHHNHNLHVHGYRENGDITTPFDMRVLNQMDRYDLVKEAVLNLPDADKYKDIVEEMDYIITKHNQYIREEGSDLPEVENWKWKEL